MQSVLILPSAEDLAVSDVGHLANHLHHWSKLGGQILPSIAIPKTYLSNLARQNQLEQKLADINALTQDTATLYHALLQTLAQLPIDDDFKRQYWPNVLNVLGEGPYLMQSSLEDAAKKHPSLQITGNSLIWDGVLKLWAQYLAEKLAGQTRESGENTDLAPTIVISRLQKQAWQGQAYLDNQNFNRAHLHLVSPDAKKYSFIHDANRGWEITPHFSSQQNEALTNLAQKLTAYQRHHLDPVLLNFDLTGDDVKVSGIHHHAAQLQSPSVQTVLGRTLNTGTGCGVLVSSLTNHADDQAAVVIHLGQFTNFGHLANFGKIAGIVCDQPIPANYLQNLCQLNIPVLQLHQPIPHNWWNCKVTIDGNSGTLFKNNTTSAPAITAASACLAIINEQPSLWQKKNLHQLNSHGLWLNWPKEDSNQGWGNTKSILKSWQSIISGMAQTPNQIVWQPPMQAPGRETNQPAGSKPSFTQLVTNQTWVKNCAQVQANLASVKNVPVTMVLSGVKTPADWLLAVHTFSSPPGLEITNSLLMNEWSILAQTPPSFLAINLSEIWQSYLGISKKHLDEYSVDERFLISQLHKFKNELSATTPNQDWWVIMDKARPSVLATAKNLGAGIAIAAKDIDQTNWLLTKN